ncbi:class II aldolase/adducin family protein [Paramuribaculum intestinale]|uniref:class II aldolase/adducin family protein n=1 Tax=Paramuribaculum intestinale TaxID=2094151 RepID=UPI0025A60609|nr:class II aldolase/adducin family protein [Paramuribaculum intestinale]
MATIQQIQEFVAMAHRVGQSGLTVCSSGNLSVRLDNDEVMISGTGSWVPDLTPDKVSVCRLSTGEVLNGIKPSMESVFHMGVMRERPEVGCVLHFQSPYATAVACMKKRPADFNFTAECPIHVGREIPMIPYFRPGSPELASHVIEQMKHHDSVMLLKHGQVVCGKDFSQALERAMFFEMACRIAVINGDNVDPLTAEEIGDLDTYILGKITK